MLSSGDNSSPSSHRNPRMRWCRMGSLKATAAGSSQFHCQLTCGGEPHTSLTSFCCSYLVFFRRSICVWLVNIEDIWSPSMQIVNKPNKQPSITRKMIINCPLASLQSCEPREQEMNLATVSTNEYKHVMRIQKTNSTNSL